MNSSEQRVRVGVVVIENNKILLMHRFFDGKEYYVIPGGGREAGETFEQTAVRELKEEVDLDVTLGQELERFTNDKDGRLHVTFVADTWKGTVRLGGEEAAKHSAQDWYNPEWHALGSIPSLNIVPEQAKALLHALALSKK